MILGRRLEDGHCSSVFRSESGSRPWPSVPISAHAPPVFFQEGWTGTKQTNTRVKSDLSVPMIGRFWTKDRLHNQQGSERLLRQRRRTEIRPRQNRRVQRGLGMPGENCKFDGHDATGTTINTFANKSPAPLPIHRPRPSAVKSTPCWISWNSLSHFIHPSRVSANFFQEADGKAQP
jgi:hypothetical protein